MTIPEQKNTAYDFFIQHLMAHKKTNVANLIQKFLAQKIAENSDSKFTKVDVLKSWLDDFRPLSTDVVSELKKRYDVKFTYNSNAIEGNTLTQSETELVLEKGITVGGKTLVEHLEAVGHKDAIDYIEFLSQKNSPISDREVKDIHHLIMKGIDRSDAGTYRTIDVRAAGSGHLYPPHYLVKELMESFFQWLSSEAIHQLHPLQLATEVHYRFVAIHPFKDGNGRTARLLMNLVLLRAGFPVVVISNSKRSSYIDALVHAQENNDNTDKLLSMVESGCVDSLIDYLSVLATAGSSKGKAEQFYTDLMPFCSKQE